MAAADDILPVKPPWIGDRSDLPHNLLASICTYVPKGGSGKTTINYQVVAEVTRRATTAAERAGQRSPIPIVLDLCPQANLSSILLGSGGNGDAKVREYGEEKDGYAAAIAANQQPPPLVAYGGLNIANYLFFGVPSFDHYEPLDPFLIPITIPNCTNGQNILLLCGNNGLDKIGDLLMEQSNMRGMGQDIPWVRVINTIRRSLINYCNNHPNDTFLVFIDTNPAFSIYTQLAIAASTHLIVPCSPDDSSAIAAKTLFELIYGSDQQTVIPRWQVNSFAQRVQFHKGLVRLPRILSVVQNRAGQRIRGDKTSAKAFDIIASVILKHFYQEFRKRPFLFVARGTLVDEATAAARNAAANALIAGQTADQARRAGYDAAAAAVSLEAFGSHYSVAVKDFNAIGVASIHRAAPLPIMSFTFHDYEVSEEKANVAKQEVEKCIESLSALVDVMMLQIPNVVCEVHPHIRSRHVNGVVCPRPH